MSAIITTKDITGAKTIDEMNFTFISSSIYAYNVGANTLNLKLLQ
jgi:putative ATPase